MMLKVYGQSGHCEVRARALITIYLMLLSLVSFNSAVTLVEKSLYDLHLIIQ